MILKVHPLERNSVTLLHTSINIYISCELFKNDVNDKTCFLFFFFIIYVINFDLSITTVAAAGTRRRDEHVCRFVSHSIFVYVDDVYNVLLFLLYTLNDTRYNNKIIAVTRQSV